MSTYIFLTPYLLPIGLLPVGLVALRLLLLGVGRWYILGAQ
jgi:hypothetical protein